MISIQKMREMMPENEKYSDEEIEKIRDIQYKLVDLIFDDWLDKMKNKTGMQYGNSKTI